MKLVACFPLFALLVIPFAFAQEIQESADADIGYRTPGAALEALLEKQGVTIKEQNDWMILNDDAEHTIWSITSDRHPAHPTAVKRAIVERDGSVHVVMTIQCGASKVTCDHVVRQFQELNENMRKSFSQ